MNDARPIVVFGDDWGRHVSTMQHVFRHVISLHPVIWVNALGHRVPSLNRADLSRAAGKLGRMLSRRSEPRAAAGTYHDVRPWAVIEPRVLPWHGQPLVDAFNARSLRAAIGGCLARLGSPLAPVVVTGSPPSVAVLGQLGEISSLYFCMDDFLHMPSVSAGMLEPLERLLLERVDLVVATAAVLTVSKKPASGRAVHLPQGVNYEHFSAPRPVPAEMAALPRPIIGFAGEVSERCDFQLLRALAAAPFTGSLVLVGPHAPTCDVRGQLDTPNVHLLGSRTYQQLPAYVQAFDVALIPYLLSDWTRAVDPLKLLEYLAAGVPVVSSDLPEVHKYAGSVRIAGETTDFVAATRAALEDRGPEARARFQAVAREHTWEARARTFLRHLDDVVARHERPALDGAPGSG